jgi:ATP-binding cassette subfamily F protein uup
LLKKPKRELLAANSGDKKVRKLSFKEQRELDALPGVIEELEIRQAALAERMSRPDFYQGGAEEIEQISGELHDVQELLEAAFNRWDELEVSEPS